jgi:hypothetical protein
MAKYLLTLYCYPRHYKKLLKEFKESFPVREGERIVRNMIESKNSTATPEGFIEIAMRGDNISLQQDKWLKSRIPSYCKGWSIDDGERPIETYPLDLYPKETFEELQVLYKVNRKRE